MTPYSPVITNQSDLQSAWRHLMGPFGYSRRSVWWMLLQADGRPFPQLTELEDADEVPDPEQRQAFAGFLAELVAHLDLAPGTSVAFLVSRPGHHRAVPEDHEWAEALNDVARLAGLGCEVVHLATDAGLLPLPLDAIGRAG